MGAGVSSFLGWGDSWGNSWGSADPNAMRGAASFSFAASLQVNAGEMQGEASFSFYASLTYQPDTEVTRQFSGGFVPFRRRKSAKEIEQERIRLGIIPDEVARVVTVVAKKAIAEATNVQAPDVLDWVAERQERYQQDIRARFDRDAQSKLIWDNAYRKLLAIAIEDELEREEEMVINLLMHEL